MQGVPIVGEKGKSGVCGNVRKLNSKLELSQLLFVQQLTKRTQQSSYQIFYTTYTITTWSVHYLPMPIM